MFVTLNICLNVQERLWPGPREPWRAEPGVHPGVGLLALHGGAGLGAVWPLPHSRPHGPVLPPEHTVRRKYLVNWRLTTIFYCFWRCVYKGRDNKLFLYAATNIKKGEKLSHSWTKNLLFTPTKERQKMLRDVFIQCKCLRCLDASEMGTNLRWV